MRRMYSENQLENQIKNVKKDVTTLVDSDGHQRFIEGDITINTISGITKTYGKWSLSGSHLLIVLCLSCANGSTITGEIAEVVVPAWIKDKIVPVASSVVDTYTVTYRASDNSTQGQWCALYKLSNDRLTINSGSLTFTADRAARITFDLLIDQD